MDRWLALIIPRPSIEPVILAPLITIAILGRMCSRIPSIEIALAMARGVPVSTGKINSQ